MAKQRDLTYQDLKQLHRPQASTARDDYVADFADNLETAPAHEHHKVVYNPVFG